jgi:hypothetical protein
MPVAPKITTVMKPRTLSRASCYGRGVDLRWTAHPAKRRPRDVALVAMVVLFSAWAVMVGLHSAFLAALAAVILLISVSPFLVPTHYRLGDDGVEERRLGRRRFRAWSELRRVQVGRGAALVSPFARKHWLERYRGLLLYLDGADRDAVIAALRTYIKEEAA